MDRSFDIKRIILGAILHESGLAICFTVDRNKREDPASSTRSSYDISPKLLELLEKLRREYWFSDPYELYDLLIAQVQLQTIPLQLAIIYELLCSKKKFIT